MIHVKVGPVTTIIVLNSVGLPISDAALVFIVDWLIDRIRTAVNITGDCFGTAIVYHLSKDELVKSDVQTLDENTYL